MMDVDELTIWVCKGKQASKTGSEVLDGLEGRDIDFPAALLGILPDEKVLVHDDGDDEEMMFTDNDA